MRDDVQPEREPSADLRAAARAMRDMYLALVREGFTPSEALAVIGHILRTGGKE